MLAVAEEKKRQCESSVEFEKGDISTVRLQRSFDAAIAMFAVMGYQTTNERLESTLLNVWHHLNHDGLLIFDAWFGPAVIIQKPHDRVFVVKEGAGEIIRLARPVLDILTHTVSVNYTVLHIEDNMQLDHVEETHRMRFFFPKELDFMLAKTGYEVLGMHPFMKLDGDLTENDWNMTVIAKKTDADVVPRAYRPMSERCIKFSGFRRLLRRYSLNTRALRRGAASRLYQPNVSDGEISVLLQLEDHSQKPVTEGSRLCSLKITSIQ